MQRTNTKPSLKEVINQLELNKLTELSLDEISINPFPDNNLIGLSSHITDNDLNNLANAIKKNTSLTSFFFSGTSWSCGMEWTDVGTKQLGLALKDHPALTNVVINIETSNEIINASLSNFLLYLPGSANLQNFYIKTYGDKNDSYINLGHFLKNKSSLKKIVIENHISIEDHIANDFNEIKKIKDLSLLSEGLAQQKNLTDLTISSLFVDYQQLAIFAKGLTEIHALENLHLTINSNSLWNNFTAIKEIINNFSDNKPVEIHTRMDDIISGILKANQKLSSLSLLFGGDCKELEKIIEAIPLLSNLDKLTLKNKNFSTKDLQYLCKTIRENDLIIREIHLGDENENNIFLDSNDAKDSIALLIENNPHIENLSLKFETMDSKDILNLSDLLANPEKCKLRSLDCYPNDFNALESFAFNIIKNNKNIIYFSPNLQSEILLNALQNNKKQNQQQFIESAITIFNGCYNDSPNNPFSKLPADLLIGILCYVGSRTADSDMQHVLFTVQLINQNLRERHLSHDNNLLMDRKFRNTSCSWWKHSIFHENKAIPIFKKSIENRKNIENENENKGENNEEKIGCNIF